MAYLLSSVSDSKLSTCDPRLIILVRWAIKNTPIDFSVVCGFRGEHRQHEAYVKGRSKADWPMSAHNKQPSQAVDIAPYIEGIARFGNEYVPDFYRLAGMIQAKAEELDIPIKWGGDWGWDFGHFELG